MLGLLRNLSNGPLPSVWLTSPASKTKLLMQRDWDRSNFKYDNNCFRRCVQRKDGAAGHTFSATSERPGGASATNFPLYFLSDECVHRSSQLLSIVSVKVAASMKCDPHKAASNSTQAALLPFMAANRVGSRLNSCKHWRSVKRRFDCDPFGRTGQSEASVCSPWAPE